MIEKSLPLLRSSSRRQSPIDTAANTAAATAERDVAKPLLLLPLLGDVALVL